MHAEVLPLRARPTKPQTLHFAGESGLRLTREFQNTLWAPHFKKRISIERIAVRMTHQTFLPASPRQAQSLLRCLCIPVQFMVKVGIQQISCCEIKHEGENHQQQKNQKAMNPGQLLMQ
ncbi:MAG: hypothetical protein HEQ17_04875 [Limnohabitans sp.]|uniref:hypothetical protein n=1 Tax=Limnohabitans sp. TaxID=1907725 RepID=UPI0025E0704F|nr:hypothetical protein [Limnohabitans sp.]MCO4088298.1 hypothetical protein [Limnohabitans sp.]